jgi:hypothetical protein
MGPTGEGFPEIEAGRKPAEKFDSEQDSHGEIPVEVASGPVPILKVRPVP